VSVPLQVEQRLPLQHGDCRVRSPGHLRTWCACLHLTRISNSICMTGDRACPCSFVSLQHGHGNLVHLQFRVIQDSTAVHSLLTGMHSAPMHLCSCLTVTASACSAIALHSSGIAVAEEFAGSRGACHRRPLLPYTSLRRTQRWRSRRSSSRGWEPRHAAPVPRPPRHDRSITSETPHATHPPHGVQHSFSGHGAPQTLWRLQTG